MDIESAIVQIKSLAFSIDLFMSNVSLKDNIFCSVARHNEVSTYKAWDKSKEYSKCLGIIIFLSRCFKDSNL